MAYSYYFKNTYYFRKIIHRKYLKDRTKNLNYRRSLKLCMDKDFYYFLSNKQDELDKILEFINYKVTEKLKEGRFLDSTDINNYIEEVCATYREEACIENSILEEKRIKDLEFIDENGMQEGFHIQAITTKYKELDLQYKDFRNKEKTQKIGMEILKRSNISIEKILEEITADKLLDFYEILIKNERLVLTNDIKTYIKRNLFQFYPLVPSHIKEDNEKVEEAHYQYLTLVSEKPKQKNYLEFIKENGLKQTQNSSVYADFKGISEEDLVSKILGALNEKEQKNSEDSAIDIDNLIEKYINYRKSSENIQKREKTSLGYLKDFLTGDGDKYKAKKLQDLDITDVDNLEKLFSETTTKQKKENRNKTLFQLVKYRETNLDAPRYKNNTMDMMQFDVKNFWSFVCKYIKTDLNSDLFKGFNPLSEIQNKKYENNTEDRELRLFSQDELQTFVNEVYSPKKIKKILMDSPKNFYSFLFGFMLGTRIAEFTYIRLEDIKVQEKNGKKIYYIWLNENISPQSLKNQNAHRNIIIPEPLIDLGFLNYIELRHKRGKEWLWDFPKSGYGSISTFYQRHINKLFPNAADTEENRLKCVNVIQLRSLRKNFAEIVSSNRKVSEHTPENSKRMLGHSEGTSTGTYLGRLEPFTAKAILDSFEDYDLDLETLKISIKDYFKEIKRDLDFIEDSNNWFEKSRVKPKKGRKV